MLATLAAALLLAAGDPPPPPLDLAPLTAPPPKTAAKPKKKKKKAPAHPQQGGAMIASPPGDLPPLPLPALTPPDQQKPTPELQTELPLPALVPPPAQPSAPPPPMVKSASEIGVLVQLDSPQLERGLQGVVQNAPRTRGAQRLPKTEPSCDDACISALAGAQHVDRVLIASYANGALKVRLLDVATRRELASGEHAATDSQVVAVGESLACQLLVPAGCTGEVQLTAASGIDLAIDGRPIADGGLQRLSVGLHDIAAAKGSKSALRTVAVTREANAPLWVTSEPKFSDSPPAPVEAVAAAQPVPSSTGNQHALRPVGYVALGAAVLAGGVGGYLGIKSHSDINSAENAFRANGGAYRSGDLATLNSGNSNATRANVLFIAAGVLAVAGGVLVFAF